MSVVHAFNAFAELGSYNLSLAFPLVYPFQESLQYRPAKPFSDLSDYVEQSVIHVGGIELLHVRSKDKYLKKGSDFVPIKYMPGFKAEADSFDHRNIHHFIKTGIPIDIYMSPDPEHRIGYLEDFKKITEELMLDPCHQDPRNEGRKPYVIAHSIRGQVLSDLLLDDNFAEEYDNNSCGTAFVATHLYSDYLRNRFYNSVFQPYSFVAPCEVLGSARWQKYIAKMVESSDEVHDQIGHLTNQQVRYSGQQGMRVLRDMRSKGYSDIVKAMNITHIYGKKDKVSCEDYIKELAAAQNANLVEIPRGHDLLATSKRVVSELATRIHQAGKCNQPSAEEFTPPLPLLEELNRRVEFSGTLPSAPLPT